MRTKMTFFLHKCTFCVHLRKKNVKNDGQELD